jgi:hypothetical protein
MFNVELSREAQRFYDRADKPVAKKLARCFELLEKNPRKGNNIKPLKVGSADPTAIALEIFASFTRSTTRWSRYS